MRFQINQEILKTLTYIQKANLIRIFNTYSSDERVLPDNPTQAAWDEMLIISRPINLGDIRRLGRD